MLLFNDGLLATTRGVATETGLAEGNGSSPSDVKDDRSLIPLTA